MGRQGGIATTAGNLDKSDIHEVVRALNQLSGRGKPKDERELKERIDSYFEFCSNSSIRPGIESLSYSLGVDRTTFWRWCRGNRHSQEWTDICLAAKQGVCAFLEASALTGRLNPVTYIFLAKNWMNYSDYSTLEIANARDERLLPKLSPEQIAQKIREDIPLPDGIEEADIMEIGRYDSAGND